MQNLKMKKGFTMFELLFVLSIISIIAGIGAYNISEDNSQEHYKAKTEIRAVKKDLAAYFKENRTYEGFKTSLDVQIPILKLGNYCIQKMTSDNISYRFSSISDTYIEQKDCSTADNSDGHRTYVPSSKNTSNPVTSNAIFVH